MSCVPSKMSRSKKFLQIPGIGTKEYWGKIYQTFVPKTVVNSYYIFTGCGENGRLEITCLLQ